MQLKGIHYFIILIGALLLWYIYSLGKVVKEGFDDYADNSLDNNKQNVSGTNNVISSSNNNENQTNQDNMNNENQNSHDENKHEGIIGGFIEKEVHKYEDKGKEFLGEIIRKEVDKYEDKGKEFLCEIIGKEGKEFLGEILGKYGHAHDDAKGSLGIPCSKIPPGQEDLYILKSQIVVPTCPKCPSIIGCPSKDPPPPCPPCARCPEPSYDCKLVPNYNNTKDGNSRLPIPILTDFSQFGM